MTNKSSDRSPGAADDAIAPASGWRFRLGVVLVALAFLSPLGALLLPFTKLSLGMKATLSGLLFAGIPEVFTVAAVAVLGKPGFAYVKRLLLHYMRRYAPPREVGRPRYYVGLVMLLLPGLYSWILTYTPPEMMPGFPEYQIHIALTMEFIFVCSFFVLGGDFWDKLRALFIYKAKAQLPQPKAA